MDRRTTVAVSGLQAGTAPAPGLEVAFCLAEGPAVRIVGLDYDPLCTGLYAGSPFVATRHMPSPVRWPAFKRAFADFAAKNEIDIFIPCTDLDVLLLVERHQELAELGVACLLPPNSSAKALSKPLLAAQPYSGPFLLPRTITLDGTRDLGLLDGLEYPLCVKGRFSGVQPAPSPAAARLYAQSLAAASGWPVLAQQWITGDEYSVLGLADTSSDLLGGAAMKKLGITETGATWAGVTVEAPDLRETLARALRQWAWVGPIELDLIRSPEGLDYLVDVNMRFPAWTAVAKDAGANLPLLLVALLEGDQPRPAWASSGLAFAINSEDRTMPVVRWLEALKGVDDDYEGFYRNV